jgi:hypothetical protein
MRTWVKVTLGGVLLFLIGFGVLAGIGAYFVLGNLDVRPASETDALRDVEVVKARFGGRQPLVEVVNPKAGDVRINRAVHPEGRRATTLHVMTWEGEEGRVLRSEIPVWLMRFSTLNIASRLGLAPEKFRLTAQDVEAYGPGIVVDYRRPGEQHVLIWVE